MATITRKPRIGDRGHDAKTGDAMGDVLATRTKKPTLELLQVHGLDVPTRQVLHMSKEGVGIRSRLFRKPRN